MTRIDLHPHYFDTLERAFLADRDHGLSASLFRYDSGVCAARLRSRLGELVVLPYQGQQIWRASMRGRDLTMKSMFDSPRQTQDFLSTYGAFFLHCGFTAMGAPSTPTDHHPLHGELPNAPYQQAWLELGEDARGAYLAIGGAYQHTVAFSYNYVARPEVRMYADSSMFTISLAVTNWMSTPLDYMYLGHINFKPVDGGQLAYSALTTPEHVRVRRSVPGHIPVKPGYHALIERLAADPAMHHTMSADLRYDPEAVFTIDYLADAEGLCHTLQVLPDGSADYVRHRPDQLPKVIRWLCRTGDQDALGMAELATAEVEGYTTEKAKGNVPALAPGATWTCAFDVGTLTADQVPGVQERIAEALRGADR